MPREIRPLVRSWKLESSRGGVTVYSSDKAVAAFAGMGAQRAALATAAALGSGPIHKVISAGWAGGLKARLHSGMVFHIRTLIDQASGEVFDLENDWREHGLTAGRELAPTLVTVDRVVSIVEKQQLREHYYADLVDMEAATVAKMAQAKRIPFLAIKGVSDEHDFDLPDMHQFVTSDGGFRERSFALYVALRPALWGSLVRMARGSSLAARNLCLELQQYIDADETVE